jgi:hypothetical protein
MPEFEKETFKFPDEVEVKGKEVNQTNVALKQNWTNKFLENDGLIFVINLFLSKSVDSTSSRNKF